MGRKAAVVGVVTVGALLLGGGAYLIRALRQSNKPPIVLAQAGSKPLSNQITINQDLRNDRNAALAMIPPAGGQPSVLAGLPLRNAAGVVAPAIAPIVISGSGSSTPLERAMHPSLSPPAGVTPSTQPVAGAQEGTYENAVNLELARKFVMSMCTDLSGRLWVGTEGGGVQCFDPAGTKWREWTQYTSKDGLGDDFGYAIVCDHEGRIWVGHLNHGVSVFNGEKWQNYEVVGGISRPDSMSGPIGERVFHITVCPTDGDVWMATSAGLARYGDGKGTWTYYTRADGLPSDQANSIAFDRDGNIYVATQCDGLAMADAADGYSHWRCVTGPDGLVTAPSGDGLPSNLLNDVLVASDGTVYLATDAGLAWSRDRGISWRFVRGADWAEKVRRSAAGPPPGWAETPGAVLAEDYCTCLSEDSDGVIAAGFRAMGWQRLRINLDNPSVVSQGADGGYVKAMPLGGGMSYLGSYGQGVVSLGTRPLGSDRPAAIVAAAPLPRGAMPPATADQQATIDRLAVSVPAANLVGTYYGEDWTTQGDWVRGYGKMMAYFCGVRSPNDDLSRGGVAYGGVGFTIDGYIGSHADAGDGLRQWIETLTSNNNNVLWEPYMGVRRDAQWDDHGEAYSPAWEGPDIKTEIMVPEGIYRISAYFWNDNGHVGERAARRDFVAMLRGDDDPKRVLGRFRVCDFAGGGVFKTFLVKGPKLYLLEILRNYSLNATCCGVFVDNVAGPPQVRDKLGPLAVFTRKPYLPPDLDQLDGMPEAAMPWFGLEEMKKTGVIPMEDRKLRIFGYRGVALQTDVPAMLLSNWRWNLHLWTAGDRAEFDNTVAEGWKEFSRVNHLQ